MPEELLPRAIASLLEKAENGFPFKSNQTGLLVSSAYAVLDGIIVLSFNVFFPFFGSFCPFWGMGRMLGMTFAN